jgi:hypothetical protein
LRSLDRPPSPNRCLNGCSDQLFDYLGDGVRDLTKKRAENLGKIILKAHNKSEGHEEQGFVPPRVIKNIFDDGSFSEDELTAEYLGGVLASSKSPNGRDDRGVALSGLVNRLSTYTLRTHYIVYSVIRRLALDSYLNVGITEEARRLAIFITRDAYDRAMEFDTIEDATLAMNHALYALIQEQLIANKPWATGEPENLKRFFKRVAPTSGIMVYPTVPGVELYLWAHGKGHLDRWAFLDPEEQFEFDLELQVSSDDITLVSSLPDE